MGEASKRSRSHAEILATGLRCIYCAAPATSIEHMPPVTMFRGRQRPSGMEFPCCAACNNGTSSADLVAGFFGRLSAWGRDDWKDAEAQAQIGNLERKVPGIYAEIFDYRKIREQWVRTPSGILERRAVGNLDGPLIKACLDTFAAKLGMAIYAQHCGAPIPATGSVQSIFFLNDGLSEQNAQRLLQNLPSGNTLVQGKNNTAHGQFYYRYNTDASSIVGALAAFHDGLSIATVAFDAAVHGHQVISPNLRVVRPGELPAMMPVRPPPVCGG